MLQIRPAAVAGTFYPAQGHILADDIQQMLQTARNDSVQPTDTTPKALIVPHAGYMYSGPVAATAYSLLAGRSRQITRVILLGPVHRVPVRGLALPGCDIFTTPLGDIEIDQQAIRQIETMPQVGVSPAAHAQEHSLEVQLPFLQSVLEDFKLVPLAVGDASATEIAQVLDQLWGGDETLIIISSDLSHFLPYQAAQKVDAQTVQDILHLQSTLSHSQACGGTPVNGLLLAAKQHKLKPALLDLRNSGDTAGDKDRVVGYTAIAFTGQADND